MTPYCSYQRMPPKKYGLLVDFGILTVPEGYDPAAHLELFQKNHRIELQGYNCEINDVNFSNPSRILSPGDRLWVRGHKQVVPGTTTPDECLAFLAGLNSHYTGAQGAILVYEQKRDQLPRGFRYLSLDEKNRLWKDAISSRRVPEIDVGWHGEYCIYLSYFEEMCSTNAVILSFCDPPNV